MPVIQSSIVFKNCDVDGVSDGLTDYNLTEANDVISNNNSSNLVFTYYKSLSDANLGNNEINASLYNNIEVIQFLHVLKTLMGVSGALQ